MLQQNKIGFDLGFVREDVVLLVRRGAVGPFVHFRPDAFLSN
jgi:hypothetical protein